MKLLIDICEKKIIKLIGALQNDFDLNIETEVQRLPLGDFIIQDDDGNDIIIIERKSLADLASSIVDGRYAEQSFRLHHCDVHNHNIMYVIEGNVNTYTSKYSRIKKKALYSAMFTLQYYKGFSVFRTMDIVETATFILRMVDKLQREHKKGNVGFYGSTNEVVKQGEVVQNDFVDTKYSNVTSRVKKANIRPDNIGGIILSQIPGISKATSSAVMDTFGSLYNLMVAIKEDKSCMNELSITTKTGKSRRISRKSIESIITYLLYQRQDIIYVDTSIEPNNDKLDGYAE